MMSSIRRHDTQYFRAISIALLLAAAIIVAAGVSTVDASKVSTAASSSKLPVITKVAPLVDVKIGQSLTLKGKNFVKGKKTLLIVFKRDGSKRKFATRAVATSTTAATVVVPDVSGDLVRATQTAGGVKDNLFRLRAITKYGASKAWTVLTNSPIIQQQAGTAIPVDTSSSGDCDADGMKNAVDLDDDNDLLDDVTEASIATDPCDPDTDKDDATDYYEWRVAYEYNGGPTLPYPSLRPYPNPLVGDSSTDFDGDGLTTHGEFRAWQYTGLMTRFYSDSNQDSDGDGKIDSAEDEDHDLLPNAVELSAFQGGSPSRDLNWLKTDTDGDGLCDGLDDQDHDGAPVPVSAADCTTRVPNNGPTPAFPPTSPSDTVPGGDPDGLKTDGDDNQYSNFYEWYLEGALPTSPGEAYNPCLPSGYPTSPYCPAPWNPLPTPDL
jgi:hypothetical protein